VSCPLACATHLRVIHHILAGLGGPYPFCCAYIDDILVFSDTLEEHITHLQQVFERLRSAVLLLHLKKCVCWHLSNILRSHNFQFSNHHTPLCVGFVTTSFGEDSRHSFALYRVLYVLGICCSGLFALVIPVKVTLIILCVLLSIFTPLHLIVTSKRCTQMASAVNHAVTNHCV